MPAAAGFATTAQPPNAVVQIQPGMNVQAVTLVDQNGQYVSMSGQFLATSSYAPPTQTLLGFSSTTFSVPGLTTTVAAGSNSGEISAIASWSSPSAGVLDVASTTGFPTSGTVAIQASGATVGVVTYTGTSGGNSLTGCAYVSGSATGTVATGNLVALLSPTPQISTGSFTVPSAYSSVLVTVALVAECTSSSTAIAFGLAAHNTVTPMLGSSFQFKTTSASLGAPAAMQFLVSVTGGDTYNFDLLGAASAGNIGVICAFSQTSISPTLGNAGVGSPVVMTVQAV